MSARRKAAASAATRRRSPFLTAFFRFYFDRFFRRHMNALSLARWGEPDAPKGAGPIVVYANHPSWWDAILYTLLGEILFSDRKSYGPISAVMLKKYGFFGRIGAFGVDLETRSGAAEFLACAADILSRRDSVLWIAAQGRFVDVRDRPLGLKPGVARLVEFAPEAIILPMAVEYCFWDERGADVLIAFGPARRGADLAALPRQERLIMLEDDLTRTLDKLNADAAARDRTRFRPLIEGRLGIGGIYDFWRRLRATLSGRPFDAGHGARRS